MKNPTLLTVVFIDDGINPAFIPSGVHFTNYTADETGVYLSKPVNTVSHGTMCYQIFHNHVHTSYHLISIKVLNSTTGVGNHKSLLSALNWCATQDIDVINMSMGTRQYLDFASISTAINRLSKTIIVAACSNENELTFPACLPQVIGVRHANDAQLVGYFAYIHNPYDQIEVATCVQDEPIDFGGGHIEKMSGANSFATPLITAHVCDYMGQGYSTLDAIRTRLALDGIKDTMFASYKFCKSHIRQWESCNIPIVAIPDTGAVVNQKLQALLDLFIQDGYRAVILSATQESNAAGLVYNLTPHGIDKVTKADLIELCYNFTLPDIIFLQMNPQEATELPENLQADAVIKLHPTQNNAYELNMAKPVKDLFVQIISLLQ